MKITACLTLRLSAMWLAAIGVPWMAAHADQKPKPKSWAEAEIAAMDTNHDGKLTTQEHASGAKHMFETMDANKDGSVNASEMDIQQRMVMGAHRPEGTLSASAKIKVIDADKDGQLSAEEHAAGSRQMFTTMDTDRDGKLTLAEIQAGHEKLMSS